MKRIVPFFAATLLFVTPACNKGSNSGGSGTSSATSTTAAKEAAPKEIGTKFTKKTPATGMKTSDASVNETALKLKLMGKNIGVEETQTTKKDDEVLEVANGVVTKARVTYAQAEKKHQEDGKPVKTKTEPVSGKSYVVVYKNDKVTVLTDKEKPAPKNEAKIVGNDYASMGKPDPLFTALPDRPLKDGEELPELADAMKNVIIAHGRPSEQEKITVETVKVVFKNKEGENGIFDVTMTMKVDAGFFKVSMPLTGKLAVRVVDAWPASLSLEGPLNLDLKEKDKKAGVEGGGTMKMNAIYAYK